jgi:hypothetical protein
VFPAVDQVFHHFHSKFAMPPKSKVVPLEKLDNFYIGRFWSVYVNFGERGKSSGGCSRATGFDRGFDQALTTSVG